MDLIVSLLAEAWKSAWLKGRPNSIVIALRQRKSLAFLRAGL
ncbi:hypothetical protein ACWAT4_24990 [Bradyrhizobium manausense]